MTETIILSKKLFKKEDWDKLCKRCGECCKLRDFTKNPPEELNEYCSNLKRLKNGKTKCRIYSHCYGTKLSGEGWCVPVEFTFRRAENCPYNKFIDEYVIFRTKIKSEVD